LMLMASRHHALLIDLSGSVQITGATTDPDSTHTDVAARVEGIDSEVILRMTQAPSGRGRVFRVTCQGATPTWSPRRCRPAGDRPSTSPTVGHL
jgi:hypothetical protein